LLYRAFGNARRLPDKKHMIHFPAAPEVVLHASVAMLTAESGSQPSNRRPEHEGGGDHERENDGTAAGPRYGVMRLRDHL
jgi:hypothetical protein